MGFGIREGALESQQSIQFEEEMWKDCEPYLQHGLELGDSDDEKDLSQNEWADEESVAKAPATILDGYG